MENKKVTKALYVQLPAQHRDAVDAIVKQTRKTLKTVMMESIEDLAKKYGLVATASELWDR